MKVHRRQVLASLALTIFTALITWKVTRAYIIYSTWTTNSATYTFDLSLPTSFYNATTYGANVWTDVTPSSWAYVNSPTPANLIKYGSDDGPNGRIAVTTPTTSGGHMVKFTIKYDSAENWYTDSGVPAINQYDLRSAAAHEFGHGLSLNHTQSLYCPGNTNNATMCGGFPTGSYYVRTLEGDDRNGINTMYP